MNIMVSPDLPVAVIGAGSVGLAAAAHLVERGIRPVIFERGASVGAALLEWSHVRVFSPWTYNIDAAASLGDRRSRPCHVPAATETREPMAVGSDA